MPLVIPKSLDNPWLDTDPKLRDQLIEAYRRWIWAHIELDRLAIEQGLDGGECDYGLIDPESVYPDLPLDPNWARDDEDGEDPTRRVAQQLYEMAWRIEPAGMRELFGSSRPHYLVLGRAIKWMNKEKQSEV
jgi:hypothetical protein